jgi:hypothetical protein
VFSLAFIVLSILILIDTFTLKHYTITDNAVSLADMQDLKFLDLMQQGLTIPYLTSMTGAHKIINMNCSEINATVVHLGIYF